MSLAGHYDAGNIFAKILRGEAPCVKVYENADALSFMDIFPQSQGHCLVIPKAAEARNLLDFPPERIAPYFQTVQMIARACVEALNPDGLIVTQFNGAAAGQTVFHLHVHLIPRYDNLPMQRHHQGKPADPEVLKLQAERIAAAIRA
jgi:histidine triad (HIT) family protein